MTLIPMAQDLITDSRKDPLGAMLSDYLAGDEGAGVQVYSSRMDMSCMTGRTMFRSYDEMHRVERTALERCRGRVLDVGAGSGCHTLVLRERCHQVLALDISPGCVAVMKQRGVRKVVHCSLFDLIPQAFDTILMLMNGIGICGSLDGLNLFFQFIKPFLAKGGQVLADSTDLSVLCDDTPRTAEPSPEEYYGEIDFVMSYRDRVSDPFQWLYIDYPTLDFYAGMHRLSCDLIFMGEDGKYLVKIH